MKRCNFHSHVKVKVDDLATRKRLTKEAKISMTLGEFQGQNNCWSKDLKDPFHIQQNTKPGDSGFIEEKTQWSNYNTMVVWWSEAILTFQSLDYLYYWWIHEIWWGENWTSTHDLKLKHRVDMQQNKDSQQPVYK